MSRRWWAGYRFGQGPTPDLTTGLNLIDIAIHTDTACLVSIALTLVYITRA